MAICLTGGSFRTSLHNSGFGIVDKLGVEKSTSLFTVTDAVATILTVTTILTGNVVDNPFLSGDEVIIKIGSKSYTNIVNGIDDNDLSFISRLPVSSGTASVILAHNTVNLDSDLEKGDYYLKQNNEQLIIRDTYNNPYITTGELAGEYRDALTIEKGMEILVNKTALSQVYSDLQGLGNIYDVIFFERIRQLKKQAMLMMLFPKDLELKTEYWKLVDKTRIVYKRDSDTGIVVKNDTSTSDWTGF